MKKNAIGNLNIQGQVISDKEGLFAIKIVYPQNIKKYKLITHEHIKFDHNNKIFDVIFDLEEDLENPPKILEFYLKHDSSSIKYGEKYKSKNIPRYLLTNLRIPLIIFPASERKKILKNI